MVQVCLEGRLGGYARALELDCVRILSSAGRNRGLGPRHEVSVMLCDGPTIRRLNRQWRSIDHATNVLSFPLQDLRPGQRPRPEPLGDIVLSLPVIRHEARRSGTAFEEHLAHMLIHGLLHLLGYDHAEAKQAGQMESEERRLLSGI